MAKTTKTANAVKAVTAVETVTTSSSKAKKSLKDRNAIARTIVHDQMVDFLMDHIDGVKCSDFVEKIDGAMYDQYAPFNPLTGKKYGAKSHALLFCIAIARRDPRFATFVQIKNDHKTLIKGSKSHEAISCIPLVRDEKTLNLRPAQNEEERANSETTALKGFNVFNFSDIKDIEPFKPEIVKHINHYDEIDLMVKNYGIKIIHENQDVLNGKAYGCYQPSLHMISIYAPDAFNDASDYYSTLLHELAHSTGNALNRPVCNKKNSALYNREELVAELSSFLLAIHFKMSYDLQRLKNVFAYLKMYATNKPKMRREKIDWALTEAEKVLQYFKQYEGNKSDQTHEEIEKKAMEHTNDLENKKNNSSDFVITVPVQTDLFGNENSNADANSDACANAPVKAKTAKKAVKQPKSKIAARSTLDAMSKKASKKKN